MSLKHVILGFLSYRSLSGYDLKKAFDRSVNHFWPADQSQIYRTLKQLHKDGLISMEVVPREERLDVKLYAITETGEEALQQWLATPLPPAETRDPFLIKLYFGFMLQDEQVQQLIQAEIDQIDSFLEVYEGVYQSVTGQEQGIEGQRPFFYSMLTLEYGFQANLWYRGWLQSIKERIRVGDWSILLLEEMFGSGNGQESER